MAGGWSSKFGAHCRPYIRKKIIKCLAYFLKISYSIIKVSDYTCNIGRLVVGLELKILLTTFQSLAGSFLQEFISEI